MVRLFANKSAFVGCVLLILFTCFLGACGGHKPGATNPFPTSITLSPSTSASLQLGSTINFFATSSNNIASSSFTFHSSDTSILNFSPAGVACAGRWDIAFTTCTPQGTGVVTVTASALGATSPPTLVFVHPPVDNIQIGLAPLTTPPPPPCPGQQVVAAACAVSAMSRTTANCMSVNQQTLLQATAWSQGVDITPSVGTFTWAAGTSGAVTLAPITNSTYNLPTNQVTVTPGTPGFTQVFASASGATSQPYYVETCPVQCVALEIGEIGSGRANFSTNKGTSETITATAVDVQGCVVPKPALTWSSSQPGAVLAGSAATGCAAGTSCSATTPSPGSGSITASCTPPSCNLGFPRTLSGLPTPLPVYPVTPITGVVSGAAVGTSVLATSFDCSNDVNCTTAIYSVSTTKNLADTLAQSPIPPNSLMFDLAGDKAYMGSNFGSAVVNVASIGTATSAFSSLGTVTGKVLAVSPNGSTAVFSETVQSPNRVYVVNAASTANVSSNTLNIYGASAAAFSPDGLRTYIFGHDASGNPNLYIFSPLQSLQTIPLPANTVVNGIAFSSDGAFAYVSSYLQNGSTGNISVYDVCDNQPAKDTLGHVQTIPLPAPPAFLKVLPDGMHILAIDASGQNLDLITSSTTGTTFPSLCPQFVSNTDGVQTVPSVKRIPLQAGPLSLVNLMLSADGSQLYIAASNLGSILVYSFNTGSIGSGIPLKGSTNPTPLKADITVDGTLIYAVGSDGLLHELSTTLGDLQQIPFTDLPNSTNAFCAEQPTSPNCTLNFVAVKP